MYSNETFIMILAVGTAAYFLLAQQTQHQTSESIRILVRQAARWAVAARQDENPLIAILHANYAAGYLWALLDIAMPDEIERVSGIDLREFKAEIQQIQDYATGQLGRKCSLFGVSSDLLTRAARGEI